MMRTIKNMEGEVNVGKENLVGEVVIGTMMMMIVMMTTTGMMTIKIEAMERAVIVREENVVE